MKKKKKKKLNIPSIVNRIEENSWQHKQSRHFRYWKSTKQTKTKKSIYRKLGGLFYFFFSRQTVTVAKLISVGRQIKRRIHISMMVSKKYRNFGFLFVWFDIGRTAALLLKEYRKKKKQLWLFEALKNMIYDWMVVYFLKSRIWSLNSSTINAMKAIWNFFFFFFYAIWSR